MPDTAEDHLQHTSLIGFRPLQPRCKAIRGQATHQRLCIWHSYCPACQPGIGPDWANALRAAEDLSSGLVAATYAPIRLHHTAGSTVAPYGLKSGSNWPRRWQRQHGLDSALPCHGMHLSVPNHLPESTFIRSQDSRSRSQMSNDA